MCGWPSAGCWGWGRVGVYTPVRGAEICSGPELSVVLKLSRNPRGAGSPQGVDLGGARAPCPWC